MARTKHEDLVRSMDKTLEKAVGMLPGRESDPSGGGASVFSNPLTVKALCMMRFRGISFRKCAKALQTSHTSVERFLRSDRFKRIYEEERTLLLARVDDFAREQLQEVLLKAIQFKVSLLEGKIGNKVVPLRLRDKAASDLYEWGKEAVKSGRAGFSDVLKRTYEKAVARRLGLAEGSRIARKQAEEARRPLGPEGKVVDVEAVEGGGAEPQAGGGSDGDDGAGVEVGGGGGTPETESGPGGPGGDSGDGSDGLCGGTGERDGSTTSEGLE